MQINICNQLDLKNFPNSSDCIDFHRYKNVYSDLTVLIYCPQIKSSIINYRV